MPGEREEEKENKKTGANEDLDQKQDRDEPVEKWLSQSHQAITLTTAIGSKMASTRLTMLGSFSW